MVETQSFFKSSVIWIAFRNPMRFEYESELNNPRLLEFSSEIVYNLVKLLIERTVESV